VPRPRDPCGHAPGNTRRIKGRGTNIRRENQSTEAPQGSISRAQRTRSPDSLCSQVSLLFLFPQY
jgi:hypothetical protein